MFAEIFVAIVVCILGTVVAWYGKPFYVHRSGVCDVGCDVCRRSGCSCVWKREKTNEQKNVIYKFVMFDILFQKKLLLFSPSE